MAIGCKSIRIEYNGEIFIKEFDLILPENKITLLYGPSGSGKTTLLNILAGLIHPPVRENGTRVFWFDEDIHDLNQANQIRHKYINLIFSQFYFMQSLSVEENIILPAVFAHKSKKQIQSRLGMIYEIFNFKDEFKYLNLKDYIAHSQGKPRRVEDLANGQKELVGIARACMVDTPFVFADELLRSYPENQEKVIWERLLSPEIGLGKNKALFMITHKEHLKNDSRIDQIYSIKNQEISRG